MTRRAVPVFVMTVLVLAAGCSSDDTADPPNSTSTSTTSSIADTTTTTAGSTTSPTTAPPTTASTSTTSEASTTSAPDALESTIQDLLDRYDAAVTTILIDPTVTSDPSSPAVTTYLALFAPGSTFAQGALSSWAQDAADGRSYRAGPGGSMIDSSLVSSARLGPADFPEVRSPPSGPTRPVGRALPLRGHEVRRRDGVHPEGPGPGACGGA